MEMKCTNMGKNTDVLILKLILLGRTHPCTHAYTHTHTHKSLWKKVLTQWSFVERAGKAPRQFLQWLESQEEGLALAFIEVRARAGVRSPACTLRSGQAWSCQSKGWSTWANILACLAGGKAVGKRAEWKLQAVSKHQPRNRLYHTTTKARPHLFFSMS